MKSAHIRSLARIARSWGGRLSIISEVQFKELDHDADFSHAPFTGWHGVNWTAKTVYAVRGREDVGAIIHEMGHVFADRVEPHKSDEFRWLGWEISLARKIGASHSWSKQNSNYAVDDHGTEWGELTPSKRVALVKERLAHAKESGIVAKDGTPLAIR